MVNLGGMDIGRLKGLSPLMEVKTIESPHQDFDYWLPNKGSMSFLTSLTHHIRQTPHAKLETIKTRKRYREL